MADPNSEKPLHQVFAELSWDATDWEEANLCQAVLYMRMAKNVKVSREFKSLIDKYRFPRDLPFLYPHQVDLFSG